jgi:GT2 family glycosyltransferase
MALIAMAVWDTEENKRTNYTRQTLVSLSKQVNWNIHRLIVVDNASCYATKELLWGVVRASTDAGSVLPHYPKIKNCDGECRITVITLPENIGTARAVNKAWQLRNAGEHCIKMDNDVVIHSKDWVDELEEALRRDPSIGIIGLKRKDCWENPEHTEPFYRSTLQMLPHEAGERWMVIEKVRHVMGTCQMFNSALLDKIGYLYQPRLYGFDDCLAATRSEVAGFYNAFLPHIEIDHIDTGETEYQGWKEKHSGEDMHLFNSITQAYREGRRPIYEQP